MSEKMARVVMSAVVVVLFTVPVVLAQSPEQLAVNVPQTFTVAGKALPAGQYIFTVTGQTHNLVAVTSIDGKAVGSATVVTRIAGDPRIPAEGKLVFDNFDNKYILAEVWVPGQDGLLISGFKNDAEHRHTQVKGTVTKASAK